MDGMRKCRSRRVPNANNFWIVSQKIPEKPENRGEKRGVALQRAGILGTLRCPGFVPGLRQLIQR